MFSQSQKDDTILIREILYNCDDDDPNNNHGGSPSPRRQEEEDEDEDDDSILELSLTQKQERLSMDSSSSTDSHQQQRGQQDLLQQQHHEQLLRRQPRGASQRRMMILQQQQQQQQPQQQQQQQQLQENKHNQKDDNDKEECSAGGSSTNAFASLEAMLLEGEDYNDHTGGRSTTALPPANNNDKARTKFPPTTNNTANATVDNYGPSGHFSDQESDPPSSPSTLTTPHDYCSPTAGKISYTASGTEDNNNFHNNDLLDDDNDCDWHTEATATAAPTASANKKNVLRHSTTTVSASANEAEKKKSRMCNNNMVNKTKENNNMSVSSSRKHEDDARKPFKGNKKKMPPPPTTVSQDVHSIVGSRPKHWGPSNNRNSNTAARRRRQTTFLQTSRHKRKAQLVAELSSRSSSITKQQRRRRRSPPPPPHAQHAVSSSSQHNKGSNKKDVSFAPAFFSTHATTAADQFAAQDFDAVDEDDNSVHLTDNAQRVPSPKSSASGWAHHPGGGLLMQQSPRHITIGKRSGKTTAGPLAKRLKAIRDSIKGDVIRFQSGQYPFSLRSMDRNDPRNRAASVCDVTLLGNLETWDGSEQRSAKTHKGGGPTSLLTALCYIHSWTVAATADKNDSATPSGSHRPAEEGLSWITFTFETAREHSLCKGSQLRIYNAISFRHDTDAGNKVQNMVLGTQLCELYPDALPPLPDVPGNKVS